MEEIKKEENLQEDKKDYEKLKIESAIKEGEILVNKNLENLNKDENLEKSSKQVLEVENREITPEIIDIINEERYKKYRGKENQLNKLKIKKDENFSEYRTLIKVADLLRIKQIKFDNIETNDFNSLLSENSLIVKKFKKIKSEKEGINNKENERQENKIEENKVEENKVEENKIEENKKEKNKIDENKTEEIKSEEKEKEENKIEENKKEENKIEEEIYLEKIIFNNCKIDIDFGSIFPLIKNITLKNCKLPYDLSSKLNFNYLTDLVLENIGLIDDNIQSLFNLIKKNNSLKNTLKKISLRNNNISIFDPCKGMIDVKSKIEEILGLSNLEILDLSNNKLVFIGSKIIHALDKIKLINLTNNNIVFPSVYTSFIKMSKKKSFLVLLTKNYALINHKNREEYIDYLLNILPNINYGLDTISLINLYTSQFYEKMKPINLCKYNNTLIELDISYGSFKDSDLKNLFKSNFALENLKYLNLSKNKLTDKFLDILVENDFPKQFSKLKKLDLSGNMLQFKQAINYQNFFEKYKALKLFVVKNTPFELSINNYTKTIINRYYEMERNKKYKTNFSNEDLEIQKIVENNNYLVNNTKVTISLIDVNNYKYVSKVKKYFPAILERIDFETRYYESK